MKKVVLAGTVLVSSGFFLASFATQLWHAILTQGLMVGCGFSFVYWPAISVVPQWFDKYRGIATGLAVLGAGLGNLASGVLIAELLDTSDTVYTLRILSVYCLGILLVAMLCLDRRLPNVAKAGGFISANMDVIRTTNFKLVCIGAFFFQTGYNIPFSTLAAYAEDVGLTTDDAAVIVGAVGIGSAVGRVLMGLGADMLGRVNTFKAVMAATAAACAAWYFCTDRPSLIAFAVIFGFASGGFISLVPVVMAEWYGAARLGSIMGVVSLSLIPGSFIGPILAGVLYDQTDSYLATCILTAATVGISAFSVLFVSAGPQLESMKTADAEK